MKLNSIVISLLFGLGLHAQAPSFSVQPAMGQADQELSVTIVGDTGTTLALPGMCASSSCIDIGSGFYFKAGTSTLSVPYSAVTLLDDSHAEVKITVPSASGLWNVSLPSANSLTARNTFQIIATPVSSFSLSNTSGTEGIPMTTVLTGQFMNFGTPDNCVASNCKPVGDMITYYGYSSNGYVYDSIPLASKTYIDSNHLSVTFIVPASGSYNLVVKNVYSNNSFYISENPSLKKYFTISPDTGTAGNSLTVTITGNDVNLGYNGSCSGTTNCTDLGNYFYFTSGTSTFTVPFNYVSLLDSNHADVNITIPSYIDGQWTLSTTTRLASTNYLTVAPQPQKSFNISPAVGEEGDELLVTITGNNTALGYQGSCSTGNCTDIGYYLYYFTQGSSTVSGVLYFNSVNILDANHVQVSVTLPQAGYYYVQLSNLYTTDMLTVNPSSIISGTLSGSKAICKDEFADMPVALRGKAPWTIVYSNKKVKTKITNIMSSPYIISVSPSATETYTLLEVTDGWGRVGTVEGSATITVKKGANATATLSRSNTGKRKPTATLRLDLKGESPWTVVMNVNGVDTLIENITASPYLITVKPTGHTVYKLTSVRDADDCTNGTVSGIVTIDVKNGLMRESEASGADAEAQIYPNPAKGLVQVTPGVQTTMFNSMGSEVLSTDQEYFDVSNLPDGVYVVHLKDEAGNIKMLKFVKE